MFRHAVWALALCLIAGCSTRVDDEVVAVSASRDELTRDPIGAFAKWVDRYALADAPTRGVIELEGRVLLESRREAMRALIQNDPEQALRVALTPVQRAALPEDMQRQVEQWVDGIGTLHVIGATPTSPLEAPQLERFVT